MEENGSTDLRSAIQVAVRACDAMPCDLCCELQATQNTGSVTRQWEEENVRIESEREREKHE